MSACNDRFDVATVLSMTAPQRPVRKIDAEFVLAAEKRARNRLISLCGVVFSYRVYWLSAIRLVCGVNRPARCDLGRISIATIFGW